jgi:hypothetical protein
MVKNEARGKWKDGGGSRGDKPRRVASSHMELIYEKKRSQGWVDI